MVKSRKNSEHYTWGDNCHGWYLVKTKSLSVIHELMPPNTKERKHHHKKAQQYFNILNGTATFEIEDEIMTIEEGNGIHVPPKIKHRIRNDSDKKLEFLVISEPTTRGDRYDEPLG